MKLTITQKRAYSKLKDKQYLTAYDLKESVATLRALVNKRVAESESRIGCLWSPRTSIGFRKRNSP